MNDARVFGLFAARLTWPEPTETLRKATWRLLDTQPTLLYSQEPQFAFRLGRILPTFLLSFSSLAFVVSPGYEAVVECLTRHIHTSYLLLPTRLNTYPPPLPVPDPTIPLLSQR